MSAIQTLGGIKTVSVTLTPPAATVTIDESSARHDQASSALRSRIDCALASAGDYSIADHAIDESQSREDSDNSFFATYRPLIRVVGFLILTCMLVQLRSQTWSARAFAADFMGGFFLAFAFFKLLDWRGFAKSFAMYDIIAMRSTAYARAYPLLEIALGIAYLTRWQPSLTNWITLAIMVIGSIGVWRAVRSNQKIQCACLGTVFDLPMSVVTVIENGTMALMAIAMLLS